MFCLPEQMYTARHAKQGILYAKSSIKLRLERKRPKRTAEENCKDIIEKNWNGKYYTVSQNHFKEFWARDTGIVTDSLIELGYEEKLKKTVQYALEKYKRHGSITTTISREGKPFSFPNLYSPDSVTMLLYTAKKTGVNDRFLQKQAENYAERVLDENGFVKPEKFSSMRDYAIQKSSCYNHSMSILMARTCKEMGLRFPYSEKELTKNLQEYWTGQYYKDTLTDQNCTGDANTFAYWTGAGKHFSKALKSLQERGMDKPFPLAYTTEKQKMISAEIFVKGWQQKTVWPMMGLLFIKTVKEHNKRKAEEYKQAYKKAIEKYGTLYEAYTGEKPYKSLFYHADKGLIWAANYLTI